jgi:hydrogenase maturation protein HypF
LEHLSINIHGIVQGIGFRPFIHRQVREHGLCGTIRNSSSGVLLELEGERPALQRFLEELPHKAPILAVMDRIEPRWGGDIEGYEGFAILPSLVEPERNTLISPDVGLCEDCRRELLDPKDRRFRYPFINCTNCGPRFTIVKDVPYDRALTSMGRFPMCPDCEREYHDIENRRYHAQPDCCPVCGPHLFFVDAAGQRTDGDEAALDAARQMLRAGKIVAVKGLGGVHLACSCEDPAVTRRLRRRKQRDEKPFAVMCRDLDCVRKICEVGEDEARLLESWRRPIVLLKKKTPGLMHISENGYVGVMLPYTPLHVLLFGEDIDMLVMTSANLSDTPIVYKNDEALERLSGIADGLLLHDREIQTRCDDSLCFCVDGKEYPVRRSRGYAPFPIRVEGGKSSILACGAEQKAGFCLSKGDYVFPGQHIGDLKNFETLENYEQQIAHFERLFDIHPQALACDLHPDYLSTAYAKERSEREGIPLLQVQHHHAHMVSCMADNGLRDPVIGLVWDGTGLGSDGTIWGGECLVGDAKDFARFGSIRPIPLIGGDLAAKELDRIAWVMRREAGLENKENAIYETMLKNGLNCPLSSGMGRPFDGAAALLGIKTLAGYEGQGAVLLEAAAAEDEGGEYPFELDGEPLRFDWRPMIRAMIEDPADTARKAAKFMNTLLRMAAEQAEAASRRTGITDVILSGGSFQNMYIMRRLPAKLRDRGLKTYHHSRVSCNDEGIALGQLMIVAQRAHLA